MSLELHERGIHGFRSSGVAAAFQCAGPACSYLTGTEWPCGSTRGTLPGVHAGRAEVIEGLRRGAAGLDPRGHLLLAFTGHSDRGRAGLGRPPEVAWCLFDGPLPLTEVAALLGTVPPSAFITLFLITGQV